MVSELRHPPTEILASPAAEAAANQPSGILPGWLPFTFVYAPPPPP